MKDITLSFFRFILSEGHVRVDERVCVCLCV